MSGDFALHRTNHEEIRTSNLKSIWENEEFLDRTIACDDDQIMAHKVILSAASPFFRNILNRNPHSHPLLYLKGTTKKSIQTLLDFIYSGETQINQDDMEEFMALARSLKVTGLVGEVADLNEENVEKGSKNMENEKVPIKMKDYMIEEVVNSSRKERKISEPRKKPKDQQKEQKELIPKEDSRLFVLSEEMSEIEYDAACIGNTLEESGSFKDDEHSDDQSKLSLTEYNERVSESMTQTEHGWNCTECPFKSRARSVLLEHVDKHIKGYWHNCKHCDKSFGRKSSLRRHERTCQSNNLYSVK